MPSVPRTHPAHVDSDHTSPLLLTDPTSTHPAMSSPPVYPNQADAGTPQRQPSFAQDIESGDSQHGFYEIMMTAIGGVFGFFGSIPCCFCFPNPYRVVEQGNVGLISRFGKCIKQTDPGLQQINVMTDSIMTVDIKLKICDIPRQYVMTKDNVGVNCDSVLYFKVVDPYVATFLVQNVTTALMERTQTTLRQIFGSRNLQELIEHRDSIAHEIERIISGPARDWGVHVEAILIKDLQLAAEVLDSLSAAAKQRRLGESKVIAAEAEVQAAQLMRKASDILNSRAAMQIRYLETLQNMAKSASTKVVFVPLSSSEGVENTMRNLAVQEAGSA
ncbi:hypothetical protein AMAG_11861 [Allomyces macrogynus ATCC 38327]|uniref:Band 7 domain-containing protein n=1 Tax=Allomyces macrogynus (strain ATCC 38327) TaxID=578462 RepID=A0A0L0SY98_ALLM3|nr:hypothetical protein AMAG_11861 [Allomyces macrogynus ATCC 38327]|eukprot:KNE67395.1 hypothetical protein AMAG_11861 [Allomyces macrogynus ATCC 38327]